MPKTIGTVTIYDAKELADLLDTTVTTIRNYLREGRIVGRKIGKQWYVSEDAIRQYFLTPAPEDDQNDDTE